MAVDQTATVSGRDEAGTSGGDSATFRLAVFGALLVVVLFAGYGLGRLNGGTASAADAAAGGSGDMAGMTAGSGPAVNENQPHTHNTDGTVTQSGMAMPMGAAVGGLSLSSGGLTRVD